MGSILGFFTTPARLQGLVVAAGVMLVMVMSLTIWALIERSGKLSAERDLATSRAQSQVLADFLGRCSAGVERLGKAGEGAIAETKRLLAMAERSLERNAAVREEIKGIVRAPVPIRPDGKPKDCADSWSEIRAKVKP